jgi:hypothetical protein
MDVPESAFGVAQYYETAIVTRDLNEQDPEFRVLSLPGR